jgi:hypothetical protein
MSISKFTSGCFGIEFGIVTGMDKTPFNPTEKYIIVPRRGHGLLDTVLSEIFPNRWCGCHPGSFVIEKPSGTLWRPPRANTALFNKLLVLKWCGMHELLATM